VAEHQVTVRLLPTPPPAPSALRRACKRPQCGHEIESPRGRSRPREFCSDICRNLYQRERDQARNALLEARRLAQQYGIDETPASEPAPAIAEQPQRPPSVPGLPSVTSSQLALSLIAQVLESIRVDLHDGVPLDLDGVLARITKAKEDGDRLLRSHTHHDGAIDGL
jgi:hypothetical protein